MLKSKYDEVKFELDADRRLINYLNATISKLEAVNCRLKDLIRKEIKTDNVLTMSEDVDRLCRRNLFLAN